MKNLILLISITFLLSCEKEPMEQVMRSFDTCNICTTTVTENGVIIDQYSIMDYGEGVVNTKGGNVSYINNSTGDTVVISTECHPMILKK